MNWIKRKYVLFRFKMDSKIVIRYLQRQGVPNNVIANLFLCIAGEYPYEKILEELAQYGITFAGRG